MDQTMIETQNTNSKIVLFKDCVPLDKDVKLRKDIGEADCDSLIYVKRD